MTETAMNINELDRISEEAFQVFRSNIEFLQVDKKLKTLTITSSIPDEGSPPRRITLVQRWPKTDQGSWLWMRISKAFIP